MIQIINHGYDKIVSDNRSLSRTIQMKYELENTPFVLCKDSRALSRDFIEEKTSTRSRLAPIKFLALYSDIDIFMMIIDCNVYSK